ncbi:PKD-like domain-containing protein [Mucilaginibacter sabulilitoris]|uniref:PKD-like domain-containing protein n=1 Tax=Mucilaginibacter sabulilitoris TaxID=1173583 RepID=A0ABZ0TFT7_9SPHI|nr:PKD-like domain-containing protein [Mucilaginibacter sabulilitoris]WPU92040.1 PKD-like domain-containing protein [Mucilaginibacter sabulilitoris]
MYKYLLILLFVLVSQTVFGKDCTLQVTVSSSGTSICSGTSVVLTANASGGIGPYTYIWNTGENTSSISVNKAGTYTVTVSDKTPGCQPVKKSISVTSIITPNAPTASSQTVCPNTSAKLVATGPGGSYQWYDAPEEGNFLASGNTYQTPLITETTTFYVQTTVSQCTSPRTAVTVNVTGRPSVTGATLCAGGVATLSASGGDSYTWYDAPSNGNQVGTGATFVTPVLFASKVYYVVAIIKGCTSVATAVTAKVTPPPQAPVANGTTTCTGSVVSLHADAPDGVFDWFDVPTGGTSLISSPDYTTPPLTANTTYYVQTTVDNCQSSRTPVHIIVTAPPQPPAAQTVGICSGNKVTLTADPSPTGTYAWYDQQTGGTLLANGVNFQTPVLTGSTTYYVQHMNAGCSSDRAAINVTVNPLPSPPVAAEPVICPGSVATLTATSTGGGTFQWYSLPTGGTLLSSDAVYVTPALTADATYYVQTTESGCASARRAIKVTVLPALPAPTVPATSVCSGNSVTLTASGSPGDYEWYDAATGGNLLVTGSVFVTPELTTVQTYYVQSTANNCTSARTPVTVNITPLPSAPTVSGTSVCLGSSANLTASSPDGIIRWYDAPTGGTLLASGNTFSTPPLVAAKTYYAQTVNGPCVSARIPVPVTIIIINDPQFEYSSGTFCTAGGNPTPVIHNPAGGTFSATPAGLAFVSTTTGQINVGASTPGKYTVIFTYGGSCPGTSSADINIISTATPTPNAQFNYDGPFCQGNPDPKPVFAAGASAGVFSSDSPDLVFRNKETGQINLDDSKAGTYTITNNIFATAGCASGTFSRQVTIGERAIVNAGPDQNVVSGTPVQLAGSIGGSASSARWSAAAGSFSDRDALNAVYTPAPGATTVTLTLTTNNPSGVCGPASSTVNIYISAVPAAPTAANSSVCLGNPATLIATAPGGTYRWFDASNGGNELFTGPIFKTPPITATAIYYVQVTKNGLTSARTPVTVNITLTPAAPQVDAPPVCQGNSATLTASGSTGTYTWFDDPLGSIVLSHNAVYNTPALTGNHTYYVQTTVNGCTSEIKPVPVVVGQAPHIISSSGDIVCSGTALNYTINTDISTPAITYIWSRAAVPGISNPPSTGTSATISETLMNTDNTPVTVKYIITAASNGCSGPPFTYEVKVNPLPVVTNNPTASTCNDTPHNFTIAFSPDNGGVSATWSRAAVAGISNAAVSGQTAAVIKEVLHNTTVAPVDVTYVFNYKTANCIGTPFNLVMTVKPEVSITSEPTGGACSGASVNYSIKSNIESAAFTWSREVVTNISNPAVSNQTSSTIDEKLINTSTIPVKVTYNIVPTAFGCTGDAFTYVVTVNPQPAKPVANSNSPVCVGNTIQLRTPTVAKASYMWTGPNGYTSTAQNPDINNATTANNGTYNLYVTVNDCTSPAAPADVKVNELPHADAGPDLTKCIITTAIPLQGSVTGGTNTGIWTAPETGGTFLPSSDDLHAQYIPSTQDKAAGTVTLTLSSTSKDNCAISTDEMTINFKPSPATDAGDDRQVCMQDESVKLEGQVFIPGGATWKTSGTGTFSPSESQPDAFYIPSAADKQSGSVKLTLTANVTGVCDIPSDEMTIKFIPPPTLNAGGTRYVLRDKTITLTPTVSDENVQYLWTPATGLSSNTVKNPVLTGDVDRTYTLQVTDSRGCVTTDQTFVKVSPVLIVPNTFTPNGDGFNDFWDIRGLVAYQDAVIDVFNRYGQPLFHSVGYPKAWEGTYNGQPVPAGTYYYKINTNVNGQVLSGYVVVMR